MFSLFDASSCFEYWRSAAAITHQSRRRAKRFNSAENNLCEGRKGRGKHEFRARIIHCRGACRLLPSSGHAGPATISSNPNNFTWPQGFTDDSSKQCNLPGQSNGDAAMQDDPSRLGKDIRSGNDRRSDADRRSGADTRSQEERRIAGEQRSGKESRSSMDRRSAK